MGIIDEAKTFAKNASTQKPDGERAYVPGDAGFPILHKCSEKIFIQ